MLKLVKDSLGKTGEMLAKRSTSPELPLTTLTELNKKMWGIHKKKLTVIAARTSNGKSALASQLAWDIASQGKKVLFITLEMPEEDMVERMFCQIMKVDNMDLLTGRFSQHITKWAEFEQKLAKMPLIITDMIGRSWQELDEYITKSGMRPDVIFIDHVQEARDASQPNQKFVIEEYLKALRTMAIRDNFAAVVLSQVNRTAQEDDHREPQLHHLKGTGYLEEGADVILLLHWPYYYSKKRGENNRFVIRIAKNRNGRTGWIEVSYTPNFYLFEDYVPKVAPAASDPDVAEAAAAFGGRVIPHGEKERQKEWTE